ncbi:hypothetical protein SAMN05444339_10713 [Loktanella atrilutea]|uniref:Flagellar protein FliL n=1 Tax=Loktanella atrilutea TaxID=366533 RepID=A0A1M5C4T9_LOKAT|nr:hypothetical protein [Loktanella atrilutea]SHF49793.1 hypothetical protein SAMN05444339_10713 [Loktanella atrilutea]
MKKIAIAVVALPLTCLGTGYAAGLAIIPAVPPPAAAQDNVDHDLSSDVAADGTEGHAATAHDASPVAAPDGHAKGETDTLNPYLLAEDRRVIRLGQMTVPVEKLHSVTYVVADFALKLADIETADRYARVEEATRLRDALLTAMNVAAESNVLRGVAIDSDAVSDMLLGLLKKNFEGVDEVLFVSLYKQDVARM